MDSGGTPIDYNKNEVAELLNGSNNNHNNSKQRLLYRLPIFRGVYRDGKEAGGRERDNKQILDDCRESATKLIFFPPMAYNYKLEVAPYIDEVELLLVRGSFAGERGKLFGRDIEGMINHRDLDIIPVVKDYSNIVEVSEKLKDRQPLIPQEILDLDPTFTYEVKNIYTITELLDTIRKVKELEAKGPDLQNGDNRRLKQLRDISPLGRAFFKGIELYKSNSLDQEIRDLTTESRKKRGKPVAITSYLKKEVKPLIDELKLFYPEIYQAMTKKLKHKKRASEILLEIL